MVLRWETAAWGGESSWDTKRSIARVVRPHTFGAIATLEVYPQIPISDSEGMSVFEITHQWELRGPGSTSLNTPNQLLHVRTTLW